MKTHKKWLMIVLTVVIMATLAVGTAAASSSTASSHNSYQSCLGNLQNTLSVSQTALATNLKLFCTQKTRSGECPGCTIRQWMANQKGTPPSGQ